MALGCFGWVLWCVCLLWCVCAWGAWLHFCSAAFLLWVHFCSGCISALGAFLLWVHFAHWCILRLLSFVCWCVGALPGAWVHRCFVLCTQARTHTHTHRHTQASKHKQASTHARMHARIESVLQRTPTVLVDHCRTDMSTHKGLRIIFEERLITSTQSPLQTALAHRDGHMQGLRLGGSSQRSKGSRPADNAAVKSHTPIQ